MQDYKKYIIGILIGALITFAICYYTRSKPHVYDETKYDAIHQQNTHIVDSLQQEFEYIKTANKMLLDEAKQTEKHMSDLVSQNMKSKEEITRLKNVLGTLPKRKTSPDSLLFDLQKKFSNIK